jgi:hypothetical protein
MTPTEMLEAIVKPARRLGIAFDEGLVQRIMADVDREELDVAPTTGLHSSDQAATGRSTLPLLEFALTCLWDQSNGSLLTNAVYTAIGGVRGALAQYADEAYDKLIKEDPTLEDRIQRVMV